ncbi:outer membrane beta-barrel protein [Aquiflexum sp. LQ15W]|uniref:outer membrane beta-barrel protein n=1 Tax=Cognataquiflexum nitidum TaxID=2922272 RepID=UPI001F1343DB|nr:outer membrane beta-barrel protein [Cognataquiflexum nitidum]MCH6200651.1 outer membrane beta-barrel protein [Cognataquiflexum nitidum]
MKYILSIFIFGLFTLQGFSQSFNIKGVVMVEGKQEALPFVNVLLLTVGDSSQVTGTVSDIDGNFAFSSIRQGDYLLKVQYLGYKDFFQTIDLTSNQDLGIIPISEVATDLNEVVIEARRSTGTQKGDTTLFNADAFKTMKDASAQTLIEKLPGVSSEDGILQAQGEAIAQILVDGKPFFGTDVKTALQNLPAEIIQSIEVFDQKSEKSQLSGFDDGERLKTINIITKASRRKGQFGKTTVGYGTDDRYLAGASINAFDEERRITFTGLTNNVNILDYSSDPNAQDNTNPQQGVITTNILGLNYTDLWIEKIKVTGSYVFTKRENVGIVDRFRDFVTTDDSDKFYRENSTDIRINNRHQANLRLEYNIDEKNRILYIPRFSARYETENSGFIGETDNGSDLINSVKNIKTGEYQDFDLFNRFLYSHKFNKPGRTVTFRTNFAKGWNEDLSDRKAENNFYEESGNHQEFIDQRTTRERTGDFWQSRVSYTEPLGQRGQMEVEYQIGNRLNDSDKLTFNVENGDFETGNLSLDTALSNTFQSKYLTQELEFGYQFLSEKLKVQTEVEYQDARLKNDQFFPNPDILNKTFRNFTPTVRMEYKFSTNTNLQFDYDTYTNEPQISQLQAVIDNTNPLQLRTGNPDLDQSYTNQIRFRFRSNNPDTDKNWNIFAQSRFVDNFISNSILIASEPTEIQDGITLETGSQLNKPVNLDGFKDFRSWLSYGMPLGFIKSNFNINAGLGFTQRPGQVNDQIGFNNSSRLSTGFSLSSNISDQVDFNVWSRSSFNEVNNSLNSSLNSKFFQQRFRVNFNWIIWEGIIYRLDLNHQINSGLSQGFDTNFSLVNMSVGKKIFHNQRGEISLMVYDLFGENANVRRNITETFVEDIQSNVLQTYVMLSFTYNLRKFSKGMDERDYAERYQNEESSN